MHLVRYADRQSGAERVGVRDQGQVRALPVTGLGVLLSRPVEAIREAMEASGEPSVDWDEVIALPPVDGRMEVWAAGVTYVRSRQARMEESSQADVYDRVYLAERPELFFKSVPWRTVTDGEDIAIRRDSALNVPEAELAVVANAHGDIVGYTVCNDVSSRTIEGDNPLYLPQAKVYAGACALASGIRPAWEIDPSDLAVSVRVGRAGSTAWEGTTSTAQMTRDPAQLVAYAYREEQFPHGVVLSTGTGIVPGLDFSLAEGDTVTVSIAEIGTLSNQVVSGKEPLAWLVAAAVDPRLRPSAGSPRERTRTG